MTEPDQSQNGNQEGPAGEQRRRRLLFRATHRGTAETDLMVGGFVRAHLDTMTAAEIEALEALMDLPDVDLADWLTGRREIPPEDASPMLLRMRASITNSSMALNSGMGR
jgi:antitoxin CptB